MSHQNQIAMSPLADPVSSAIFANVDVAGLAAESLIGAVLADAGDMLNGRIIGVTPQKPYISLGNRGCRVDIEMPTDVGDDYIVELQISPDAHMITRDLFSASHKLIRSSESGDRSSVMARKLPKVIYINILAYVCRSDNEDIVQPFGIMYKKEPIVVATPIFRGYNIQLPKVLDVTPNFDSPLYCWCYALYTAHAEGKTIREVVDMSPGLQVFAERDSGFTQFCERYNLVSADPETREQYVRWAADQLREEGIHESGRLVGKAEGKAEGRQETLIEVYFSEMNLTVQQIAKKLDIGETDVKATLAELQLV